MTCSGVAAEGLDGQSPWIGGLDRSVRSSEMSAVTNVSVGRFQVERGMSRATASFSSYDDALR